MATRSRDPNDPAFPHGSAKGYDAGCRKTFPCPATPTCWEMCKAARAQARKEGRVKHYVRAKPVFAYVQSHLDRNWSLLTYASAADVNPDWLRKAMHTRTPRITDTVARKLVEVTEEALYEASVTLVPAHVVRWKAGSLCAIGWPVALQAKLLGYSAASYGRLVTGEKLFVRKDLAEDLSAFFDQVRNVPCTSPQRFQALILAARHGFQPPDAYAPDGRLWDDDVRDEKREARWARRDAESLLRMRVAKMAVRDNLTLNQMCTALGLDGIAAQRSVLRARNDLGLKWTGGKVHGPEPGQEKRIAEILAVVAKWEAAGELADPHPFCVELGMMTSALWMALDGKPRLEAA